MSSPLAINDVVQVVLGYTLDEQQLLMVLHYRVSVLGSGVSAEGQLDNIAQTMADSVTPGTLTNVVGEALSNETFMQFVQAQRVKPTRTIYQRALVGNFGAIADPAAPVNVAVSIEKQSLKVGRRGVGRVQLGGIPKAVVDSRIDPTFISGPLDNFVNFLTTLQLIPLDGSLALKPCLPAGGTDLDYDLWDAIPQSTTRTMHRRTLGLGI